MRLFFAIDVPPLPPWVPGGPVTPRAVPEHITVRFLGDVSGERLDELRRAGVEAVEGLAPFPIELAPVGAFPSDRSPRVVYVAASTGAVELAEVARRLSDALSRIGIPPDPRPFVAHVTWRRIRSSRDRELAKTHVTEGRIEPPIASVVRALLLKESELAREGASHRTIGEFPLGSAGSA